MRSGPGLTNRARCPHATHGTSPPVGRKPPTGPSLSASCSPWPSRSPSIGVLVAMAGTLAGGATLPEPRSRTRARYPHARSRSPLADRSRTPLNTRGNAARETTPFEPPAADEKTCPAREEKRGCTRSAPSTRSRAEPRLRVAGRATLLPEAGGSAIYTDLDPGSTCGARTAPCSVTTDDARAR